jgi:hypothetical protein
VSVIPGKAIANSPDIWREIVRRLSGQIGLVFRSGAIGGEPVFVVFGFKGQFRGVVEAVQQCDEGNFQF